MKGISVGEKQRQGGWSGVHDMSKEREEEEEKERAEVVQERGVRKKKKSKKSRKRIHFTIRKRR